MRCFRHLVFVSRMQGWVATAIFFFFLYRLAAHLVANDMRVWAVAWLPLSALMAFIGFTSRGYATPWKWPKHRS